jgi:hypothetical protein
MKHPIALLIALTPFFSTLAQMGTGRPVDLPIRTVPASEPFSTAIGAVLHDFPDNLRNITGQLVLAEGEIENYSCTVELPGAEQCVITRYHSMRDSTVSWQAKMYSNEDFEKAAREYHALYRKLEGCTLLLADSSVLYLKGEWEPAREKMSFTTSTLRFTAGDWRYREVQIQVELTYLQNNWVVNINIFNAPLQPESGS